MQTLQFCCRTPFDIIHLVVVVVVVGAVAASDLCASELDGLVMVCQPVRTQESRLIQILWFWFKSETRKQQIITYTMNWGPFLSSACASGCGAAARACKRRRKELLNISLSHDFWQKKHGFELNELMLLVSRLKCAGVSGFLRPFTTNHIYMHH